MMISSAAADTWGLDGPAFFGLYLAICALGASVAWLRWRSVFGPPRETNDPTPEISAYKVAMLTGGPRLAVIAAATRLHRDGALITGPRPRSLIVGGDLPPGSEQLDSDVYDAVRREPGITASSLRRALDGSPELVAMAAELELAWLLADRPRAAALRRDLAIAGGILVVVGIARIAADASTHPERLAPLGAAVVVLALGTVRVTRRMSYATSYGADLLRRLRKQRRNRAVPPHAGESVMAVALFGAGALWLADPSIAAALGVSRELAGSGNPPGYTGCGSSGGVWFGGGPGGDHGGGGHGCGHGCGGHGCGGGH